MTVVTDYTALLSGGSWNDEIVGQSSFVTYSFPDSAPSYLSIEYSADLPADISSRSASREAADDREALHQYELVSGVHFIEVQNGGDISLPVHELQHHSRLQ